MESTTAASSLVKEVEELCARGNLHLHKFISNDRSVIYDIPPLKRVVNMRGPDMSFGELPIERALGIHWCVESDQFNFRITLKDQPPTRRGILSTVADLAFTGFEHSTMLSSPRLRQHNERRIA